MYQLDKYKKKLSKIELLTQNPIKSLGVLLQSFQIAEMNKDRYIAYLEESNKNQSMQLEKLIKKNKKLDSMISDLNHVVSEQENTIKRLETKRSRSRNAAPDYLITNSRERKNRGYSTLTPNRTIASLDSMSSAARDMDSILNGIIEDNRNDSKRNISKKSRKPKQSKEIYPKSKGDSRKHQAKEAYELRKRKRSYNNYDETLSNDSEYSLGLRQRGFKH